MLKFPMLRTLALVLVMIASAIVPGLLSPAGAHEPRGSIVIHSRVCPEDVPSGANVFDACHGNPGPEGAEFRVDNRQPKETNSSGNVSFGRVTAGDHLIYLTSDWQPNEFLGMRVWCDNSTTDTGPNEATILSGDQVHFWVRVAPGSRLTCDVYFYPESGR